MASAVEPPERKPHPGQVGRGHRAPLLPGRASDHLCPAPARSPGRRTPLPGRAGSWSGRLNRRWTSSAGVRRTSPKPSAVVGSTRLPSHGGGARPTIGRPLSLGFRGDFDAVGEGESTRGRARRGLAPGEASPALAHLGPARSQREAASTSSNQRPHDTSRRDPRSRDQRYRWLSTDAPHASNHRRAMRAGPRRAREGASRRQRASVGSAYGTPGRGPHRRAARPAGRRSSRRPGHRRAAS